jgi:hypothetical protein
MVDMNAGIEEPIDRNPYPSAALIEGNRLKINASGRR